MKTMIKLSSIALLAMIVIIGFGSVTVQAAAVGKQTNLSGLVGWWTFDEGAGTVAHDFSGMKNHGTISSSAWSSGKLGKAIDMISGSSVSVPSTNSLQFGTNSFTVAMWGYMRTGGSPYSTFMISKYNDNACYSGAGGVYTPGGWEIGHGYSASGMNICYSDGVNLTTNDSVTFDDGYRPSQLLNKWAHIVVVVDKSAGRIKFYVNGVKQTNEYNISSVTGSASANGPLRIGQLHGWQTDGKFDELRIYNRALEAVEVLTLYKSGEGTRKVVSNSGLVAWWKMDEATSTIAHDFSGNRFNATLTNGPTWTRSAKKAGGLVLDGVNDYVATGAISTGIPTNGPATVSGWFYPTTTAVGRGSAIYYFRDLYQHSLNNYLYLLNGADYFNVATVLTPNRWHHIAYTYSGTHENTILYLNGVPYPVTIQTASQNHASLSPFYIGSDNGGTANFPGRVDDVRIYNRVLSAAEVKKLYDENSTTVGTTQSSFLTNGLVGYWSFNGIDTNWANSTAVDRSSSGNNGTLTNMSQGSNPTPGKLGQALSFNGSNQRVTIANLPVSGTSDLSMFAWVKTAVTGTRKGIMVIGSQIGNQGIMLFINASNQVEVDASGVVGPNSTVTVTDGKWHHVGFIMRSGSVTQIYVDGVASGTAGSLSPNLTSAGTNWIGEDFGLAYFNGTIDEPRVYNRALTAAEVKQLYLQGK